MQNTARERRGPSFTGRAIVATLVVLPVIVACSESSASETKSAIAYAAPMRLGDGTARTYVVRDSRGVPTSLGVELTESALRNLPDTPVFLNLPFPREAGSQYTFNMLHWNPAGHMPNHVYTVPHFDFHFYMANEDDVMAIAGGPDSVVANSHFVPRDYIAPGNEAIQGMGVHWVDATSGEFNGKTFDQTFIWGFSRGELLFIEPMITKAFLESTASFTTELKQPKTVQRTGLYPKRYSIRHDTVAKVYRVTLDELTSRVQPTW
jgi:hypothetical protein